MPATLIIQSEDHYFRFQLVNSHQQVLLFSRLYRSLELCEQGIQELKMAAQDERSIQTLHDRNGHFSYVVRNHKEIMIAHSVAYYSPESRDHALQVGKRSISAAAVRHSDFAYCNSF